jgi:hypothetical protein
MSQTLTHMKQIGFWFIFLLICRVIDDTLMHLYLLIIRECLLDKQDWVFS